MVTKKNLHNREMYYRLYETPEDRMIRLGLYTPRTPTIRERIRAFVQQILNRLDAA